MVYTPSGMFTTGHKMRLLLAECPTVQEVLECVEVDSQDRVDEALTKIADYGEENFPYPCVLIEEQEVHILTDTLGDILNVEKRDIDVWISFYIPDTAGDNFTASDEKAWVREKFSDILSEILAKTGRGESIPGHSHILVERPVFAGADRRSHDERSEEDSIDIHQNWPLWFGAFSFEVH